MPEGTIKQTGKISISDGTELGNRCRFPSLQTADVRVTFEYHGFKNPRLFALSGIASFRPPFITITEKENVWKTWTWIAGGFQASGFIMSVYQWRLKDAKLNSRGLLSPWKPLHTPIEKPSGRRESATHTTAQSRWSCWPYLNTNKRCSRWAKANNLFQHLSAVRNQYRFAVRCWNLRLSERRAKLAWAMTSVSKLNCGKLNSAWRGH